MVEPTLVANKFSKHMCVQIIQQKTCAPIRVIAAFAVNKLLV